MSWDKSPESLQLELNNLKSLILDLTSTPNISFENIKGLGQFSGIALKMLFLDAHMKAADHAENFGESIQRRINFLIAGMKIINASFAKVSLDIQPKFTFFLPKNDLEMVEMLTAAVTGGIMSKTSATGQNPLVDDADTELNLIKEEANSAGALDQSFN
jgi:SPP1 family phage portal protein